VQEIIDGIAQELRRGTIVIAVLSQLKKEQYGYSLMINLENYGFKVDQGTIYPLLRRLESQKILKSNWDTGEARPKKYYTLTDFGEEVYYELVNEFNKITKSIQKLTGGEYEIN
jgi:DNA-binding PadR family transcriptional regulator